MENKSSQPLSPRSSVHKRVFGFFTALLEREPEFASLYVVARAALTLVEAFTFFGNEADNKLHGVFRQKALRKKNILQHFGVFEKRTSDKCAKGGRLRV